MPTAYVRGYGPLPDKECKTDESGLPIPETVIGYSSGPDDWRMARREEAEAELRIIKRHNFHVGLHYCDFEVVELPEGDFAIACHSHP